MQNKLLTIYGARLSKNGQHINLTLVEGEGEAKTYYTACAKVDKNAKVHASIENATAVIVVPLLKDQRQK